MSLLLPEIIFAAGILGMLVLSAYKDMSLKRPFVLLILVGIFALTYFSMDKPIWMIENYSEYQHFHLFPSSLSFFSQNFYIVIFKIMLLIASLVTTLTMPQSWFRTFKETPLLLSMGILGMLLAASASDLMALYLSVEMQALAFCLLIPIGTHFPNSKEAAIKYFAMGSVASGVLLYGISLVYISTQSTFISTDMPPDVTGQIGLVIIMVAVLSKVGVSPFHFWVADVYQGSPNYITAFMATAVKLMGIVLLFRIIAPHMDNEVISLLVTCLAALSMIWASLMALRQDDFKRLIAYSSVGHMGYILAIFLTSSEWMLMVIYTFAYLTATLGTMLVLMSVNSEREKEEQALNVFAGLSQQSPLLALQMTFFLLSLAGIPFTAGFWGKFWIFAELLKQPTYPSIFLLATAGITTVISSFYYLRIIRKMYFDQWLSHYRVTQSRSRKIATMTTFALVVGFVLFQVQVYGMI